MGNKSSPELTLSLLLMAALYLEAFILRKAVYCPPKNMTWPEARLYCQENYIDMENSNNLATITQTNRADLNQTGWIGLYREAGETWSWIGNLPSDYRNWAPGEPLNADCASFDPVTEAYHSKPCSKELPFLCYDDNLVVVKENKTWEEALKHCQTMEKPCSEPPMPCLYQYSLLSLEHFSNYDHIRDRIYKATTDEVWMGLRFLGEEWWWVSGHMPEDQGMLPKCPSHWKHCGTVSKHDTRNWITRDCSERRNFICQRIKFFVVVVNRTANTQN
ncbi:macrophage mannose receptor 1-like [Chelmon rostratus]|uniref:macrophage mannose receptor 1-like n=1 Tax=Chelmon rostratus TaxID=109905 RepID=UPI001BE70D99|nr:macrophage mannose receptor 1-like [Chelmon rostratus]